MTKEQTPAQAVERKAAVPGGVTLEAIEAEFDKAVEYVPTGWRETYPALRSRSLSEIRQAVRALFAATPAAKTAPDAGLVEALLKEVAELPNPERTLLSHNERVLIEFCNRLGAALARAAAARVAEKWAIYGSSVGPTHWQPLPAPPGAAPPPPVSAQTGLPTGVWAEMANRVSPSWGNPGPPVSAPPAESGEVERLTRERDHWKANHDEMAARNRLLRDRPDLPAERLASYDALVARTEAADAKCRELEGQLRIITDLHNRELARNCELDDPTLPDRISKLEGERDEALKEHTDMMWQRRRADERADRLTTAAQAARDALRRNKTALGFKVVREALASLASALGERP